MVGDGAWWPCHEYKTSPSLPSLAVQETTNLVDICWKVGGQGAGSNLISQRGGQEVYRTVGM